MKNKYIFISKLVFFTKQNELIEKNLRLADYFDKEGIKIHVIAKYNTIKILRKLIPRDYKEKIKFLDRSGKTIDDIKSLNNQSNICCMIGVVDEDAIFSFRCKIPLFNPEPMSKRLIFGEKVKNYGLPIKSFTDVVACLKAYEIHESNYFNLSYGQFSVYSLNNANTYYRPEKEKEIKQIFEANLKGEEESRNQKILLLLLFHLINEVSTKPHFKEVEYWGTFPSSNPLNSATSVSFLKESVRKIVGGGPKRGPEILIRKEEMKSKHSTAPNQRKRNKCDKDFDTLIVNPEVIKNIEDKVVCIIDDYITNGYSAEAAKHLLFKAGARKVIFLSFGKFGKNYTATSYKIEGEVSKKYRYTFLKETRYGEGYKDKDGNDLSFYNLNNDQEILGFGDLID